MAKRKTVSKKKTAAKRSKGGTKLAPANDGAGEITDIQLKDALADRYLAYAMSTITSRSLPDVRDGLKPVHRRLLFAMRQLKLDPKGGFKKCARVVGDVIGKYHPHGDSSVYDALVRLAQDFAQRYPLVDGQGNFGNIDGDNAAAMRYTEARMTLVADKLLEGINEESVDFRPTYDGEEHEPIVLPAAFPNLLCNGSAGIAVGMATSIPPHNVVEVCEALLHLIKTPKATAKKLVDFIPGPDFPTGGILVEDRDSIIEAYKTGRGGFRIRAKWEVEKLNNGLYRIVVTEIPYQVQKSRLIEKIADLLQNRKLPLLADVLDQSAEDVRMVLEPRSRTVDPEHLMEQLFRQTDLEVRIGLNMNVLDAHGTPGVMGLRDVLQAYLDHRMVVLERRTRFRLGKIVHRLEILDGFLKAFINLDKVIKIIRSEDEPKPKLMKAFKLTDMQAEAILNMRLRQLRKLEEMEIRVEDKALKAEQKELGALMRDKGKRWKVITNEITDLKKIFGPKGDEENATLGLRQTKIGTAPTAVIVPLEAMIEKEPLSVFCSEKGWVRAARGHVADPAQALAEAKFKEGDGGRFALLAQTTDKLIIFGTDGRFYTVGCDKLPGGRGFGEPIRLMIGLGNEDDIAGMFIHQPGRELLVASDGGRGFRVQEDDVIAQTKNGKQVLNLGKGEKARACCFVGEGHDMAAVIGTGAKRKMLIFPLAEIPVMGRGRGVILQRFGVGSLGDVTTLNKKEGLSWQRGQGRHIEENIKDWFGKRAQAGRQPPRGFPAATRFT